MLGWVFEEVVGLAYWAVLSCCIVSGVCRVVGSGGGDGAGFCGALKGGVVSCVVVSCVVVICVWGAGLCGFCNRCRIASFLGVVPSLRVPLVGFDVGGCGCGCV